MAGSSNNIDTGALYFGAINPTVTGQEVDNDSYIVTSDGTPTGTPISFWKFDEETLTWVQVPSGGTTCPAPMTRVELITLRNASGLDPQCHYVVTDPASNGTLQLQRVILHALDANTLSMCYLKTAHDNVAWRGVYNIDDNLVYEVYDNRNNRLSHNNTVISFPYNTANVYNNDISNTTITYIGGTLYNNVIHNCQQLVVGGTNFEWNQINGASNINITGGIFNVNKIETDANVIKAPY